MRQSGKSVGLFVPVALAQLLDLEVGTPVSLRVEGTRLVIEKVQAAEA